MRTKSKSRHLACGLLGLDAGCNGSSGYAPADDARTTTAEQHTDELGAWGVDLSIMNRSVDPGDDFFEYVNG
jgi:hypothetical protein